MSDLRGFATRMSEIGAGLARNVGTLRKTVAKTVVKTLVETTPADTGVARSNWLASLGRADGSIVPAHAPGQKLGLGETANATAAYQLASQVIDAAKDGEDIVIQNNLDYIEALNNGTSKQAPANFIEAALMVGEDVLKQAKVVP